MLMCLTTSFYHFPESNFLFISCFLKKANFYYWQIENNLNSIERVIAQLPNQMFLSTKEQELLTQIDRGLIRTQKTF